MFIRLLKAFRKAETPKTEEKVKSSRDYRQFTTDLMPWDKLDAAVQERLDFISAKAVHPQLKATLDNAIKNPREGFSFAMDSWPNYSIKSSFFGNQVIPPQMMLYFAQQTFIGYQLCAMLAQQWLISKCCLMPAEDATRNGYEVTSNDGEKVDPKVLDQIRDLDVQYKLNANLIQFVQFGRIFGIRIAMFKVESNDPEYYYKPYNPDGVTPGSYKGISQIDPYWVTPQLDPESAGDPSSIHFYEPTWWNIAGKLVHRTHLIICRTEEVADLLKPAYIYGGVPIPQKIYSRVYAAERTANEAPMLALTKRSDVLQVDMEEALADQLAFDARIFAWSQLRDNYGIKTIGLNENVNQFDTSLNDLDAVIMTQYQLVAAAANIPAVKLLGTSPKGFNATGEYEEANYHEMLESIQTHWLSPLIERHHELLIRSEVAPGKPFKTTVMWKPLDAMTAKEQAELNKMKAETGVMLTNIGAIDGGDERQRIISDPESGYTGLINENPDEPIEGVLNDPEGGSLV